MTSLFLWIFCVYRCGLLCQFLLTEPELIVCFWLFLQSLRREISSSSDTILLRNKVALFLFIVFNWICWDEMPFFSLFVVSYWCSSRAFSVCHHNFPFSFIDEHVFSFFFFFRCYFSFGFCDKHPQECCLQLIIYVNNSCNFSEYFFCCLEKKHGGYFFIVCYKNPLNERETTFSKSCWYILSNTAEPKYIFMTLINYFDLKLSQKWGRIYRATSDLWIFSSMAHLSFYTNKLVCHAFWSVFENVLVKLFLIVELKILI